MAILVIDVLTPVSAREGVIPLVAIAETNLIGWKTRIIDHILDYEYTMRPQDRWTARWVASLRIVLRERVVGCIKHGGSRASDDDVQRWGE